MQRLLLVDDEESIRFALKKYLERSGYAVDSAPGYDAAVSLLAANEYVLVIFDLRLTGTRSAEGLDLLSYVRQHSPETKALLLSAYVTAAIESDARERGASLVLRKPVALQDLGRAISDALAEAAPPTRGRPPDMVTRDTLDGLLELISTAVVSAGQDGHVTFVNRAALEILGLEAAVATDREVVQLFGGNSALRAALTADGTAEVRISFSLERTDGRVVELGLAVVSGGRGALKHVILFRDLGDQRRLETEMRRVERLASVGRLAAGFAHEIRNPLASIQGLAELTLAETDPEDSRYDYARRTLGVVKRIERLVRGALDFAEPAPVSPKVFDATALAQGVLEALAPERSLRGRTPHFNATTTRQAWADPDQVAECLRALLENAIEAVAGAGTIEIQVADDDDRRIRICVLDSGPGIPEGDQEHIFDPFFTTKPKGTGLGLAVAQAITVRNGGSLSVQSRPGETAFCLRLPAAPPAEGGAS